MLNIILIMLVFWIIGGWFYQQHEHVKFNYDGSHWQKFDSKMSKPYFKNNSHPEREVHPVLRYLPFTWDGYHAFSWLMKVFYVLMAFTPLYYMGAPVLILIFIALVFGVLNYFVSDYTYYWTFK